MWFGENPPPAAPAVTNYAPPAQHQQQGGGVPQGVMTPNFGTPNAGGDFQQQQTNNQPPVGSYGQPPMSTGALPPNSYQHTNPMAGAVGGAAPAPAGTAPAAGAAGNNGMVWVGDKWYHVESNQYYDQNTGAWTAANPPPPGYGPSAVAQPQVAAPGATPQYGGGNEQWSAAQTGGMQGGYAQPTAAPGYDPNTAAGAYGTPYPQTQQPIPGQYPQAAGYGYGGNSGGFPPAAGGVAAPGYDPTTGYYASGQPAMGQQPGFPATGYAQPGAAAPTAYGGQAYVDPNAGYNAAAAAGVYNPTNPPGFTGAVAVDPNNQWAQQQQQPHLAPAVTPVQQMTGNAYNAGGGAPQGGYTGQPQQGYQQPGGSMGGGSTSTPAPPGMCKFCKTKPVWKENNGRAHEFCGKTCARNSGAKV